MPWPPGFVPVANVDHATGVCAGVVVANRAEPPDARRRARCGNSPALSISSTMVGSNPSSPRTIVRRARGTRALASAARRVLSHADRAHARHPLPYAKTSVGSRQQLLLPKRPASRNLARYTLVDLREKDSPSWRFWPPASSSIPARTGRDHLIRQRYCKKRAATRRLAGLTDNQGPNPIVLLGVLLDGHYYPGSPANAKPHNGMASCLPSFESSRPINEQRCDGLVHRPFRFR